MPGRVGTKKKNYCASCSEKPKAAKLKVPNAGKAGTKRKDVKKKPPKVVLPVAGKPGTKQKSAKAQKVKINIVKPKSEKKPVKLKVKKDDVSNINTGNLKCSDEEAKNIIKKLTDQLESMEDKDVYKKVQRKKKLFASIFETIRVLFKNNPGCVNSAQFKRARSKNTKYISDFNKKEGVANVWKSIGVLENIPVLSDSKLQKSINKKI